MVLAERLLTTDLSRVWLIEHGAHPGHVPIYEGRWKAGNFSWPQGDKTPIYIPSPDEYGQFDVAGSIRGERGSPSLAITAHTLLQFKSTLLRLLRAQCPNDLQIHLGQCKDPQDFNNGFSKVLVLTEAELTDLTIADLGALETAERAVVNEEAPFSGVDFFQILPTAMQEQAASEIVQEVIDVIFCDRRTCGECGIASDGCQIVFALTLTAGGSPGLAAEIIFTEDQGNTYGQTNVTTLAADEDPNAFACIGINLVVISEDSESLHYAPIVDILDSAETWIQVTTGFVATNGPLALISITPQHTWIVAENGYVYFTADPTAGVEVNEAGLVTTEDLLDIHGINTKELVAVGNNNALILTRNGGDTWSLIVGPNVGVALNTIWMKSADVWLVGDAGGQLWWTENAGTDWTEKTFPGSGTGSVRDLNFSNNTVGYMAHDLAAGPSGRILRTIDGGYSWFLASSIVNLTIPDNDRINSVVGCEEDVNVYFGGGLGDNGTDGILVKGAADAAP